MKRLKIILQHRFIYFLILFIALVSYFVCNNLEHISVYDDFSDEEFIITNINIKDYGIKLDLKGKEKVIGYLYYDEDEIEDFVSSYELGDKVLLSGDISDISNNTVPDTFNYKKYLVSNRIYNVINITSISKISDNKNIFYSIKNKLLDRGKMLDKSYPYISSLIFGNNSYLDEDVLSSYRENGISHLFAISGLHISIFIMLISVFLDKLKVRFGIKSIILILFLLFYMFLTNFSMSVLRGAIFTILLLVNKMFKLNIPSVNLLLLAFSIILFNNPLNLNNVGLEYSFLVTLFLILYSNLINGKGKIYCLFMISFIAFLVSYPITINNFNQVNFLSVIYNLFFVPYVSSILLPFTLLSYVFPFLDSCLCFLIRIIEMASQFLDSIDFLKLSMCKMNVLMIVSYFVIICKLFSKWNNGRFKYLVVLVLFFVLHFCMPFKKDNYIMFVDVGQGDSSIISVNNRVTLIDTGGVVMYSDKEYTYKLSRNVFIPYLKANGIRKIDNLVLTHGDADHMKEAYYLIDNFLVDKVLINSNDMNTLEKEVTDLCFRKGIDFSVLNKGEKLDVGGYELLSLNGNREDENDSSIVLYGKINKYRVLFTGDISKEVEREILDVYNIEKLHILKLAHHGSDTSNDFSFLNATKPKLSIISSGKDNRFGHPSKETIDSLNELKLKYLNTSSVGSIKFFIDDGTYLTYPP